MKKIDIVTDAILAVTGLRTCKSEPGSLTIFHNDEPVIRFVRPNIHSVNRDDVPINNIEDIDKNVKKSYKSWKLQ